ncbi:MAG: selenide, water dikinase SelD, partial [Actinomycetota bacterium]
IESEVRATVAFDAVPFLPGAVGHATAGVMPGGSRRNLDAGQELLDAGPHEELHQLLIADAQTSGGLVFGVDPGETAGVLAELAETGHTAARIGSTETGTPGFTLR